MSVRHIPGCADDYVQCVTSVSFQPIRVLNCSLSFSDSLPCRSVKSLGSDFSALSHSRHGLHKRCFLFCLVRSAPKFLSE
jgi:hypothetical protein